MRQVLLFLLVGAMVAPLLIVQSPAEAQPLEGFLEVVSERTRTGKLFQNTSNPNHFQFDSSITTVHYESVPYSNNFDTEVDLDPRRINNAQLDGWLVTVNGFHYALGQPGDKTTDGWVGFGGRGGQHFFEFRLSQVGYIHWPPRTFDDIGGTPNYARANLQGSTQSIALGNSQINVSSIATWSNLWTTPGGGALNVSWLATGDGLKEEVTINEAGRNWIRNNRPPTTPLADTYLAFVFEVDWNDIPKVVRNSIEQNRDGDFDDNNGTASVELRDAIDRLLAFMPVGEILVRNETGVFVDSLPLRRRWYEDAGNHFMVLGARTDLMNDLAPGDLVYDPTVSQQVNAGANDCDTESESFSCSSTRAHVPGNKPDPDDEVGNASFRWASVPVPQGATIENATFNPFHDTEGDDGPGTRSQIHLEDADDPAAPTSLADFNGRVRTANFTDWDDEDFPEDFQESPGIESAVQEVVNRSGWTSGNAMQVFWDYVPGEGEDMNYETWFYDEDPSRGAFLNITFIAEEVFLTDPVKDPLTGNTTTPFNFSIQYNNSFGVAAAEVKLNLTDATNMTFLNLTMAIIGPGPNATYFINTTIPAGDYVCFFWANSTNGIVNRTGDIAGPLVTEVPPSVTTLSASPVFGESARLRGDLTALGSNVTSVNVSFEWGDTIGLNNETTPEERFVTGVFTFDLVGLMTSTEYFFRAKANGTSIVFSAILNFTTQAAFVEPNVQTVSSATPSPSVVLFIGSLTDFGELNITQVNVSFEWGFAANSLDFNTTRQVLLNPTDPFTATIIDLDPGTTIFFRARADWNGTAFGAILSVTTPQLFLLNPIELAMWFILAIWLLLVFMGFHHDEPLLEVAGGVIGVAHGVFLLTLTNEFFVFIGVGMVGLLFLGLGIGRWTEKI